MDISTETYLVKSRLIHMGYGITHDFIVQYQRIKPYLVDRLIKYALKRLDSDLEELILTKKYKVKVERFMNYGKKGLTDSDYQVSFISDNGLMISVDTIYINGNYRPCLDHGVSLAENQ